MIDLTSPDRKEVHRTAHDARSQLSAARALLLKKGWTPSRVDRLRSPWGTEVETGYTYGESRLVIYDADGNKTRDLRLTGRNLNAFNEFKTLVLG